MGNTWDQESYSLAQKDLYFLTHKVRKGSECRCITVYTCYYSICRKWYKHHHSQLDKEVSLCFSHCFLGKVGRKEGAGWDHWNEPQRPKAKAMDLDEIIGDPVSFFV